MGHTDGRPPPKDPDRLPQLPRERPRRTSHAAPMMSTGEPDTTETGYVRFGGGPTEKAMPWHGPRRRPTRQPARFGKRSTEKDLTNGTSPAVDFTREGVDGKGQGNGNLAGDLLHGQVRFGGGRRKRPCSWQGPRWRPTRRH